MNPEDITYEHVVEAMRFAMMAQKDDKKLIDLFKLLLEYAPGPSSNAGFELLTMLLAEGTLKLDIADAYYHRG